MLTATPITVVAPAPYITITLAAEVTGLTRKAIERKIEDGKWLEGEQYRRSPDGTIFISLEGYAKWVEKAPASKRANAASASNSH